MINVPKLTSEDVHIIVEACRSKSKEIGIPMDIAVVDEGGNLLYFERMDGAVVGGIQLAIDKAYTAAIFGMRTEELGRGAQPGGPDFGLNSTNQGRLIIFGGGVPIRFGNDVVGSIGCSSAGNAEQDASVAEAGVKGLQRKMARFENQ